MRPLPVELGPSGWASSHLAFRRLCCVFIQIDVVCHRNNFASRVVAARWANVVWAAKFATVFAFLRVRSDQRIMCAAVVAARFGDFILLDSHVATFVKLGGISPSFHSF